MLMSGSLILAQTVPLAAEPVRANAAGRPALAEKVDGAGALETCRVDSESDFRARVAAITLAALEKGMEGVDFPALVRQKWRERKIGATIDSLVDAAIEEVRKESSWGKLVKSLAYKEEAKALAETVAERVYRSERFKAAILAMAGDVGGAISARVELATIDAALPAMRCVRGFLGPRYGALVANVVGEDTRKQFSLDPAKVTATISKGDVLLEGGEAIAGAVILLVRRSLANMARRIGQRVVGALLGRLVSLVAGGVGLVLIAKDIWQLRHGVLPIIAEEMKSAKSKEAIRAELAKSLDTHLRAELAKVADETADKILDVWRAFKRAHGKVVELAERHPPFRAFLDRRPRAAIPKVDRIIALVLAREGEKGVLARLADGTLEQAANDLPEAALTIAQDTGSLDAAFAWRRLAGERLDKVVALDIHRLAKPESFTRQGLEAILALEDRVAITKLVALSKAARAALGELGRDRLKGLARSLTPAELAALSAYVQALPGEAGRRLVRAVALAPEKMAGLTGARVQRAVLASADRDAALDMMLRTDTGPLALLSAWDDAALVLEGKVSPVLLWEKHPIALSAAGLVAALLLAMLWRIIMPRRPRVIVQAPGEAGRGPKKLKGGKA